MNQILDRLDSLKIPNDSSWLEIRNTSYRLLTTKRVSAEWFVSRRQCKKYIKYELLSPNKKFSVFKPSSLINQVLPVIITRSENFPRFASSFDSEFVSELSEIHDKINKAQEDLLSNDMKTKNAEEYLNKIIEQEDINLEADTLELIKKLSSRGKSMSFIQKVWDKRIIHQIIDR